MKIRIITKAQEKEAEELLLRKLTFQGNIQAERVAQTGTVDYKQIAHDAINIAIVDDVIVNPVA